MKLDKSLAAEIRKSIVSTLNEKLGEKYNVNFEVDRVNFSDLQASVDLKVYVTSGSNDGKKDQFKADGFRFGIPSDWYGKEVFINGEKCKVDRINTRARSYPLILTSELGKQYKASVEDVRRWIG